MNVTNLTDDRFICANLDQHEVARSVLRHIDDVTAAATAVDVAAADVAAAVVVAAAAAAA